LKWKEAKNLTDETHRLAKLACDQGVDMSDAKFQEPHLRKEGCNIGVPYQPIPITYQVKHLLFLFDAKSIRRLCFNTATHTFSSLPGSVSLSLRLSVLHVNVCRHVLSISLPVCSFVNLSGTKELVYQGEDWLKNPGVGKNGMTLVRGGFYGEFPETAYQCSGKVCPKDPAADDEEENPKEAFCDVRFDRIADKKAKKPPEKFTCYVTGKIFCADCCRFPIILPEFERDPSAPKEGKGVCSICSVCALACLRASQYGRFGASMYARVASPASRRFSCTDLRNS